MTRSVWIPDLSSETSNWVNGYDQVANEKTNKHSDIMTTKKEEEEGRYRRNLIQMIGGVRSEK